MRKNRLLLYGLAFVLLLIGTYVFVRKFPRIVRPEYPPQTILVNRSGTCALIEYKFEGGERWSWLDPYAIFTLSEGDAFYTVVDLKTKKIVRDNTAPIVPITAYSQESIGMGDSVFYWSADGTAAAFPGGDGPSHEWTGIEECRARTPRSAYANMTCRLDERSPPCETLRKELE